MQRKGPIDFLLILKPELCVILAAAVLFLSLKWVISWCIALIFHEFFHYAAIRLCGCRVHRLELGVSGAIMETDCMTSGQEFICAAAGPVGNLCLLLFGSVFPIVAICAFCQFVYNILPIYPMDGGRMLMSFIGIFIPPRSAERWTIGVGFVTVLLITIACVFVCVRYNIGIMPVIVSCLLWAKLKIPCKDGALRVQ